MKKYILYLIVFLFLGCTDFLDTWDGYEIKKGENFSHRSGMPRRIIGLQDGRHMRFDAYFTNSNLYDIAEMGVDKYDINKLYGFTDVNSPVDDNSTRIGWRHDGNGKIEIFAYWHRDGDFGFEKLGETSPYEKDEYELWAKNDTYYYRFNNVEFSTKRSVKAEHGLRVRLWPYFGGDADCPNDMIIFIHEYS